MRLLGPLGLAALALVAAAPSPASIDLDLPEARLSCKVPDWDRRTDAASDRHEKVYGVQLLGPREAGGMRAEIKIEFYAPGNILFPTASSFLKQQTAPPNIPLVTRKLGKVRDAVVGALPAKRWNVAWVQAVPPNSVKAKRVPMKEETVLIEALTGFYVLSYKAPAATFALYEGDFSRALKTFHPSPAR